MKVIVGRDEAFASLKSMDYPGCLKTLYRQIKKFKATGSALTSKEDDGRGKQSKLDEDEKGILRDWVINRNDQNLPICLDDVKEFIEVQFEVEVSRPTVCRYLAELGMSLKTCMTKTAGFKLLPDALRVLYWDFILEMRRRNVFFVSPDLIRSIDCTYTSKPKRALTTFSLKGGGKQRAQCKVNSYTDGIITMISADGLNHTPSVLYTHNVKANPVQANTERGNLILLEFKTKCEKYGIHPSRVNYIPGNKKYYVGEKPEMYEHFIKMYEAKGVLPRGALILHDGGNAFKRGNESIFPALGFTNHETYASAVHQFLSPNDNKLHGVKATWSKEYYKFEAGDTISASLRLMQLLDEATHHSRQYFRDNLTGVKESDLNRIIKD